jgi:hypothetical protein
MPKLYLHYAAGERPPFLANSEEAKTMSVVLRSNRAGSATAPIAEYACNSMACTVKAVVLAHQLPSSSYGQMPTPRCPCCRGPLEFVSYLSTTKMVPVREDEHVKREREAFLRSLTPEQQEAVIRALEATQVPQVEEGDGKPTEAKKLIDALRSKAKQPQPPMGL